MKNNTPNSNASEPDFRIFASPEELIAEAKRLEQEALTYRVQDDICDQFAVLMEDQARKLRFAAFCAEVDRKD